MKHNNEFYTILRLMSDDIPIYEFNMLKYSIMEYIDNISKKERTSKDKHGYA